MSGPADCMLELMFEWMKEAEECSSNLRGLALELESLREKCNAVETVSSTAAVTGTVLSFLAAPFTGGASLVVGVVAGGLGAGVTAVTKLAESFESSSKLERVKKIDQKCNQITSNMEFQYSKLRCECPISKNLYSVEEIENERDKYVMKEFLKAMLRRSGLDVGLDQADLERFIRDIMKEALKTFTTSPFSALLLEVIGVLTMFSMKFGGTVILTVAATGGLQIGKTVLFAGASAAFLGVAALGYSLIESISNWNELIENNHETKASQSLKDTARRIDKAKNNLSNKLSEIEKLLREAVNKHRSKPRSETRPETVPWTDLVMKMLSGAMSSLLHRENTEEEEDKEEEKEEEDGEEEAEEEDEEVEEEEDKEEEEEEKEEDKDEDEEEEEEEDEEEEEEEENKGKKSKRKLKMALINARSADKFNHNPKHSPTTLIELILSNHLDILLITETWLPLNGDGSLESILPEGYSFISEPRFYTDKRGKYRGGGVAMVYSNELIVTKVDLGFTFLLEYTAASVSRWGSSESVLILTIYQPPQFIDLSVLRDLLEEVFKKKCYANVIIGGDLNVWINDLRESETQEFLLLLAEFGLVQHVSDPTRGRNILDPVISSPNVPISNVSVQPNVFSDHNTVFFSTNFLHRSLQKRKKKNKKVKRFKLFK